MFSSVVLDVAVGLIFGFLAMSLATSAIVEAIASLLKWRSRTLLNGVKQLVNDQGFSGLAKSLYEHAAINPRGPGRSAPTANLPAYIDPAQFANAVIDITGLSQQVARSQLAGAAPSTDTLTAVVDDKISDAANPQINQLLRGIIERNGGDLDKIRQELAAWFDNGMDRLSGAYKRWTQALSFAIAIVLTVLINVDAIELGKGVWKQPTLVSKLSADAATDAVQALEALDERLPVGWNSGGLFMKRGIDGKPAWFGAWDWARATLGWLITAFATLFGAPFWFDALQSITRLKGTGPSPDEKASNRAAAA